MKFKVALSLTILTIIYLIWWDINGVHGGYYDENYKVIDYIAYFGYLILIIIFFYSLSKIKKEKINYIFTISILLFGAIFFGTFKSPVVLRLKGCHESMCNDLKLRENGEFDLIFSTQTVSRHFSGKYRVIRKSIYLYSYLPNTLPNEYLKLKELKSYGRVGCVHVDFKERIGYLEIEK
jgi:hypothetical protein